MAQKIQIRRGTDANRQTIVPYNGEPIWTTDTHKLYVGDGATIGGILASNASSSATDSFCEVIPETGNTALENFYLLNEAISGAYSKRPYNLPLSENNRYAVLIYPGLYSGYNSANTNLTGKFVDLIGIGSRENIILSHDAFSQCGIRIISGYSNISNMTIKGFGLLCGGSAPCNNCNIINVNFIPDVIDAVDTVSIGVYVNNFLFKNCNITSDYLLAGTYNGEMGIANNFTFKDCFISGLNHFESNIYGGGYLQNLIIDNCNINSDLSFYACDILNFKINNSKINSNNPLLSTCQTLNGLINNCEIKSYGFNAGNVSSKLIINNSAISGTMSASNGLNNSLSMKNCIVVNNISSLSYTLTGEVSNVSNYSGRISHCSFNRPIYTGITGGYTTNHFNIVDPNIQYPNLFN